MAWRRASRCLGVFVLCVGGCVDDARSAAASGGGPIGRPPEVEPPALQVAANDARTRAPLDATPSPDGSRVYYLANAPGEQSDELPGVFGVAADGGAPESLAQGAPLVTPVSITTALDGRALFVADTAASAVFTLDSAGGTPTPLAGTEGYQPASVTVARRQRVPRLYFTGRDPDSGQAGLFSVPLEGGATQIEAAGEPFVQPGGVAVSASGDAYVVDLGEHLARVLRVRDGQAEPFVTGIGVGYPSGVALSRDERTLMVSGLDPSTRRDVVYFVNVASGALSQFTHGVGAYGEAAGLHRAHDADVFAWADSRANAYGTVYLLKF